jgi:UDP-glucose 4-epimerase
VRAVEYLLNGGTSVALNLGTGTGTTVKELLSAIEDATERPFPVEYVGRREGDSTTLVANNDKAKAVLGWAPKYDLSRIIESAWKWHAKSNHH